jgi:hypothetical protein
MNGLAAALDEILNPGLKGPRRKIGFALLLYDFDTGPNQNNVNYVGNGERKDVRAAMKEVVARWDGQASVSTAKQ